MKNLTEPQRDARARSAAKRLDLLVRRSRRNATFMLVNPWLDVIVAPSNYDGCGMTLEELESELRCRGAYDVLIVKPRW